MSTRVTADVRSGPYPPYPAPAAGRTTTVHGPAPTTTSWGSEALPGPAPTIPAPPRRRRLHRVREAAFWWAALRWSAVAWVVAALLTLTFVANGQSRRIDQLQRELAGAQRSAAAADAGADARLDGLERQSAALDKRSKEVFDPRAIAASALPQVFQVIADDGSGSAFAIGRSRESGKTNVLTAFHVVERVWAASRRTVLLERDDRRFTATITEVSRPHDLALLTIDTAFKGIAVAKGTPATGEQVLVVGAPLGLTETVTTGVVSAIRPRPDGPGTVLQFDASVNPGNSGGPVVNARKEVVGIADAKARDAEGIGLAVPIKTACSAFRIC